MTPETYQEVIAEYRASVLNRIMGALAALGVAALGVGMFVWLIVGGLVR